MSLSTEAGDSSRASVVAQTEGGGSIGVNDGMEA
jgi:hypothetical protein